MPSTARPRSQPTPSAAPSAALLEYVTLPFCRDCVEFEVLLERVRNEFPTLEIRAVAADSARGRELSLDRGIMRFPVIVLNSAVIGIESIAEQDLRRHLSESGGA